MLVGVELLVVQLQGDDALDSCDDCGVDRDEAPGLCCRASAATSCISMSFGETEGYFCGPRSSDCTTDLVVSL